MNIRYILKSIIEEAAVLGACGEPVEGVRLSGAVNKERGEGYLLLYEDGMLVLLYRRLGQRDYEGCVAGLAEWSFSDYREEKYMLSLEMSCREATYTCEFSVAERESAEKIFNAITASRAEPQSVYSEKTLLMASLLYTLGRDENDDGVLALLGRQLFLAARRFAMDRELKKLVTRADELFTVEQKKSLLLNLIELRMSNGVWRSGEADALRELAGLWQISDEFFDNSVELSLLRWSLGNLFAQ